jgi:hypothetical protein
MVMVIFLYFLQDNKRIVFLKGKGLCQCPVHKSTGPVEILTHVQFLYTYNNLNGSNILCTESKLLPSGK